jgi:hypothetical protein
MPFVNSNDYLTGRRALVTPTDSQIQVMNFELDLTTADLTLNNTGAIGILPARCVPVNLIIAADDMDSNASPTLLFRVGLLNADSTDLSTVWATSMSQGQSAIASTQLTIAFLRQAPDERNRTIGLRVQAAPATAVAGKYNLFLHYTAAR